MTRNLGRLYLLILVALLALAVCMIASSCHSSKSSSSSDDDTAADDDSATGCAPITDPMPPSDQIYYYTDTFTSMADYVAQYQGKIIAMAENITMADAAGADSFNLEMPQDLVAGDYDLRWDGDPQQNQVMVYFIKGLSITGTTYDKAFYAYRGCMTIVETGDVGANFTATFKNLWMTEAILDLSSGSIQIIPPGQGVYGMINNATITCKIAQYSNPPQMSDLCMHTD